MKSNIGINDVTETVTLVSLRRHRLSMASRVNVRRYDGKRYEHGKSVSIGARARRSAREASRFVV